MQIQQINKNMEMEVQTKRMLESKRKQRERQIIHKFKKVMRTQNKTHQLLVLQVKLIIIAQNKCGLTLSNKINKRNKKIYGIQRTV